MKATFFTLAVAGLAAAQNLDGVAPCVRSCIEKALGDAGCKGSTQEIAVCACKPETQAKLLAPVTTCATTNKCDTADLIKAQSIAAEQCKKLSTGTGSGSATGSSTGSGSATGSTTGAGSTTASMPTLTTGTGGVPTNSMNQTTSGGATGTTKAPTTSQGGSGTTTGSGSNPSSTGAAAGGPVVGALAAVLAAAFAL
ncbi:hypothetical protein VFPPC_08529 [Pochonia chlamydosporia 170]|uniref:CFEM domain-containing protein n=1 Tax=Pochonia chlamydosporia 170 TaxID=1380566 RepID=A0A179FNY4_METCM|nr:hypothetical protein VFPPC_08529 [Pochonia chlamydosporia 170]OAQ67067.1 hypothetical protein VFPPC_08529 [Pochonia chlamydosporia 170]